MTNDAAAAAPALMKRRREIGRDFGMGRSFLADISDIILHHYY